MRLLYLFGLLSLSLLSCDTKLPIHKLEGFAQGTTYHISFWSTQPVAAQTLHQTVTQEFSRIDALLSNYRPDSTIENFNHSLKTDDQTVGQDIIALVRIAQQVHQSSQGCYDLTIKPLFDLWGFQGDSLNIPTETQIQTTLKRVGMPQLTVVDSTQLRKQQADLQVDLSSIAQGYSVEKISSVLEAQGIQHYLVEIGGELKAKGYKPDRQPWRIAIEKPLPGQQSIHKIITLPADTPTAVMTSGTYRHYFDAYGQRYSHILDARTGKPVSHNLVSVTVLHADPATADAWSTALLCLGLDAGKQLADAQQLAALFITQQDSQLEETKSAALSAMQNIVIQ